ncbi:MAG: death-on-curing protein [Epulopiscium sp. Nele67-Bin004]|nr:MAG: death-on-curing protein [Epulopiscium sp. Nele67-Bin004]
MIVLSTKEIIEAHSKLIKKTGGLDGIRDIGLLESAVYSIDAGFGDDLKYPTVIEKASRLAYSIINNHVFIDGNKRTGILVMLLTLRLNDINLSYSQQELIDLGLNIADSSYLYEDIYNWVKIHQT